MNLISLIKHFLGMVVYREGKTGNIVWGRCSADRLSYSGSIFFFVNSAISWQSEKIRSYINHALFIEVEPVPKIKNHDRFWKTHYWPTYYTNISIFVYSMNWDVYVWPWQYIFESAYYKQLFSQVIPCHSSLPSQQSQTPSFIRLLKMNTSRPLPVICLFWYLQ